MLYKKGPLWPWDLTDPWSSKDWIKSKSEFWIAHILCVRISNVIKKMWNISITLTWTWSIRISSAINPSRPHLRNRALFFFLALSSKAQRRFHGFNSPFNTSDLRNSLAQTTKRSSLRNVLTFCLVRFETDPALRSRFLHRVLAKIRLKNVEDWIFQGLNCWFVAGWWWSGPRGGDAATWRWWVPVGYRRLGFASCTVFGARKSERCDPYEVFLFSFRERSRRVGIRVIHFRFLRLWNGYASVRLSPRRFRWIWIIHPRTITARTRSCIRTKSIFERHLQPKRAKSQYTG